MAKQENMKKIKLFKDNSRYREDVFVGVNGETYLIRRGETVEVPDYVVEVLENSDRMDALAARKRAEMENKE